MAPLVSEVAGPEPEIKTEAPVEPDFQSKAIETEYVFSPAEEITADVATGTTSDSPIHDAVQNTHELAAQEVYQPQSNIILVAGDHKEDQLDVTTASIKLEGFGTAEDITNDLFNEVN